MRLIDADNAIHALGVFSDMEHGNKHFLNGINSAKEIINECVTIDAVPVVRCESCKHWDRTADCLFKSRPCSYWSHSAKERRFTMPDDYCSSGVLLPHVRQAIGGTP
jgi:hypothetical protein